MKSSLGSRWLYSSAEEKRVSRSQEENETVGSERTWQ